MGKVAFLSALLMAVLAIANATIYQQSIITTTTDDVDALQRPSRSCREQIQSQDLSSCNRFLLPQAGRPSQHEKEKCCRKLWLLDYDCTCEELKNTVGRLQGQLPPGEARELKRRACELAESCHMGSDCCQPYQQSCREQLEGRELSSCKRYLRRGTQSMEALKGAFMNAGGLSQCCGEMKNVDRKCKCEALREMVRELQKGERADEKMQDVKRRACKMASQCGMDRRCCEMDVSLELPL